MMTVETIIFDEFDCCDSHQMVEHYGPDQNLFDLGP